MRLGIHDEMTIAALKTQFSKWFPFLRLDFFFPGQDESHLSPSLRVPDETTTLGSLRRSHHEGTLTIHATQKVAEVEKLFLEKFGLNVQISRRSGTRWLITTYTNDLTLDRQNELGKEMSVSVSAPEPEDIHEQA